MIKKHILITIISSLAVALVASFVMFIVLSQNNAQGDVTTNTIDENKQVDTAKFLYCNSKDVTLFENSQISINDFVYTVGEKGDWTITYYYDSTEIEIDAETKMLYTKAYSISCSSVLIMVDANFDYESYEEFEDIEFPLALHFNVNILPLTIEFYDSLITNSINDFDVEVLGLYRTLSLDNMSWSGDNILCAEVVENTEDGGICFNNVQLNNCLQSTLQISYTLQDDNHVSKTFNHEIVIKQDKSLLEYSWEHSPALVNHLYLARNDLYDENYPCMASMSVQTTYDLTDCSSYFVLLSGDSDGLVINSTILRAKKVGEYTIKLVISGQDIFSMNIIVENIPVLNVYIAEDEIQAEINEEIDLSIDSDDIFLASPYAIYDITYTVISDNQDTCFINNGVFVAMSSGEYVVRIMVGEVSKDITITVPEVSLEFYLVDNNSNKIQTVTVNKENILYGEYFITCHSNIDLPSGSSILISSTNAKVLSADYAVDKINLMLDYSHLDVNDEIVLNVQVVSNLSEELYTQTITLIIA